MPIIYQIDPERNLVLAEGYGNLSFDDLREFRAELVKDPLFHAGMKELADFRSVEQHDFTREGFMQFLDQEKHYIDMLRDYQIAIVTVSDLHYGFARMYIAQMGDQVLRVQVFRDIDEAKDWLLDGGGKEITRKNPS